MQLISSLPCYFHFFCWAARFHYRFFLCYIVVFFNYEIYITIKLLCTYGIALNVVFLSLFELLLFYYGSGCMICQLLLLQFFSISIYSRCETGNIKVLLCDSNVTSILLLVWNRCCTGNYFVIPRAMICHAYNITRKIIVVFAPRGRWMDYRCWFVRYVIHLLFYE